MSETNHKTPSVTLAWKRLAYRLARNPFVPFVLAPFLVFVVQQRFPSRVVRKRERIGVYWTNGALLAIVTLMSLTIGIKAYLLIQLPVIMLAATAGVGDCLPILPEPGGRPAWG